MENEQQENKTTVKEEEQQKVPTSNPSDVSAPKEPSNVSHQEDDDEETEDDNADEEEEEEKPKKKKRVPRRQALNVDKKVQQDDSTSEEEENDDAPPPPQQQQTQNQIQQEDSDDDDEHHDDDAENVEAVEPDTEILEKVGKEPVTPSKTSQQQPVSFVPSPPKSNKPNITSPVTNKNNNNTTKRTASSSALPPVNTKKGNPNNKNNNLGNKKQSIAFQHKVANHNFRDFDDGKPTGLKVERNPKVIERKQSTANIGNKKQSMAFAQKAKNHKFRDDDKSGKPDFKVDRHPKELDSDKPREPRAFDKKNPESGRRESVAVQVLAKNHKFRDEDDKLPPFDTRNNNHSSETARSNNPNTADIEGNNNNKTGREKVKQYQQEHLSKAHAEEAKKQAKGKVAPPPGSTSAEDANLQPPSSASQRKKSSNNIGPRKSSNISGGIIGLERGDSDVGHIKRKYSTVQGFGASASAALLFGGVDAVRASGHPSFSEHSDATFPRQPRCNPDSLEVPVSRITDILWDKQVASNPDHAENFPISKLPWVYNKIWPGHALTDEIIDMASSSIVSDRDKAKTTTPDDALTHKEFNLCHRIAAHLNNWYRQKIIPEDTPHVLDVDAYAKVADRLRLEKPGKLYMELTDMRGDALPLGKLAKHFAAQNRRRTVSSSLLGNTHSSRAKHDGEHDEDHDGGGGDHVGADGKQGLLPKFPRQPKCDAEDLTLPTSRILNLMFNRYAATPSFILQQKQKKQQKQQEGGGGDGDKDSSDDDEDDSNKNTSSNNLKAVKIFPNSKFYGAMGKIWPGHTVPRDFVDDAIDVIVLDYRDDRRKKHEEKLKQQEKDDLEKEEREFENTANGTIPAGQEDENNNNKKNSKPEAPLLPEDFSKDGLTKDEFVLAFRIIANLSNWRLILPTGSPKLLGLEEFALAADRLRLDKPAKMFMEFTGMGAKGDGVSQAQLAMYYALKRKTFRKDFSANNNNNDEEDDEEDAHQGDE